VADVLLVDDDKRFLDATVQLLQLLGHRVTAAESVASASILVNKHKYTHMILDLILPDGSGLHLLEKIPADSNVKITLITGHPSIKSIVKNLYGSNISYLIKPIDLQQLETLFEDKKRVASPQDSTINLHFNCLVGESSSMKKLYEMITRVAATKANVMLFGESGVGKEMIAAAIHYASKPSGDYVAANCGAFSRELINSELFGHEKGAFTGAVHRKIGVFEQAHNGTLFLDEITEMPIDLQPNLLRVLETKEIVRVGATNTVDIDCRVVSATNRAERDIAEQGCLREDLYFRLAVFPIHIPPLRERKEDIPLLVQYFLSFFNNEYANDIGVDDAAMKKIMEYDWPGNVRELRHVIHRAYIMADQSLKLLSLPENMSSPFSKVSINTAVGISVGRTVEDVERELIKSTLEHVEGDKKQAADMLGISLKTLYNRINSYEDIH